MYGLFYWLFYCLLVDISSGADIDDAYNDLVLYYPEYSSVLSDSQSEDVVVIFVMESFDIIGTYCPDVIGDLAEGFHEAYPDSLVLTDEFFSRPGVEDFIRSRQESVPSLFLRNRYLLLQILSVLLRRQRTHSE